MMKDDIISYSQPKSIASEAYRALRTNLEFCMSSENLKTILITSSHVSEGKSSVSSNLATVFAMRNKKTILIDADMRRGHQYKRFGVSNSNGLSNYLANLHHENKELIKKTEIPNLSLITSGIVPPNPAELLSLDKMKKLLDELKDSYDVIILDGTPILPVTDSVILSSLVDKVVIVSSYGETHKEELKSVKETLDNVGADIAGVILNKAEMKHQKYGKSYYGNYYYSTENEQKKAKK